MLETISMFEVWKTEHGTVNAIVATQCNIPLPDQILKKYLPTNDEKSDYFME